MTSLPDRLGANLAGVLRRLRRMPAVHPVGDLHRIHWAWWLGFLAIGLANLGLMADAAAAAWPARLPDGVAAFFASITGIGRSGWILIVTGLVAITVACADWPVVALRIRAAWAEIGVLAAYVFFSVGIGAIVTNVLKQLIGRSRPAGHDEVGALALDPFNFDYANASFPSGHATTVGATTLAFMLVFPRARLPIATVGLTVAFSRVMVGAHYPSDVLAGLAVGGSIAYLAARHLARRTYGFAFDPAGRLHAETAASRSLLRQRRGPNGLARGLWDALVGRAPSNPASPGPAPAPDRQ